MAETTETLLAHGVGGSTDLPIPLAYALIGGVWALIVTFAVVAVAWRTPRARRWRATWTRWDAVGAVLLGIGALLAFSALPTASTCYVLAARMGYNGSYVAGLVTLSTLLGLVSLPLALGLLR